MLIFWVVVGALTALAAGLILMRAAGAAASGAADPAPVFYRRQLAEIDELAERGLIGEAERRTAHAEAARRLLAASEAPKAEWSAGLKGRRAVLLAVVAVPALALGLYLAVGAPGFPDQPYEKRLAGWRAAQLEALTPPEIAAVLRRVIRERPGDAEGLRLLALAEGASDNPSGAVRALRRAVAIAPERADLWRMLGEALVYQAGGKIEPPAVAAFREALRREPSDLSSRFYLAQARIDAGQTEVGVGEMRALLGQMPQGDERRPVVEAALARAEGRPPPAAQDQMPAIRAMVDGLAARLKQNPDDPEGWVRLVRAYAVLGDTARRDEALASARARYAADPALMQRLEEAAKAAPMP